MEVGEPNGFTQVFRCLQAMEGRDAETRASLWRAALKYARKARLERTGLESHRALQPQLRAPVRGGRLTREVGEG